MSTPTQGQGCPLPSPAPADEEAAIRRMLAASRVAVVGISDDPSRPSNYVSQYLQSMGIEVLPVNPKYEHVLGVPCYESLSDVPEPIEVVDIFRRAEQCPEVVREAIAAGAKGIWLQSGIISPEARRLASDAGIDYVENRCMMVEHRRRR